MGRYRKLATYMKKFHLVLSYNWGSMDGVMARTLLGQAMGLPPLIHHEDGFNHDEIERSEKAPQLVSHDCAAARPYAGGAVQNTGANCADRMAPAARQEMPVSQWYRHRPL